MTRSPIAVDSPLPVSDAPLSFLQVLGAILLTLVTGAAIFAAGVLVLFCSF